MVRRLVAVPAALLIMLFTAAIALGVTVQLHQGTNIAWNDPGTDIDCEGRNVPSGMVLWHFVAHTTTNDFTMDASFVGGPTVTDMVPTKIVNSYQNHWDVLTSLTTLTSASITGSGTVGNGGFNLSSVCPNPGEEIPEAPASALLIVSAALLGGGFLIWKRREGASIA